MKFEKKIYGDSTQNRAVFQQQDTSVSETKSQRVSPDFLKQFDLSELDEQQRKIAEEMYHRFEVIIKGHVKKEDNEILEL